MIATENDYNSRTALQFLEWKINRLNKGQRKAWVRCIYRLLESIDQNNDEDAAIYLADVMGIVDMHLYAKIGKQVEVDDEEAA